MSIDFYLVNKKKEKEYSDFVQFWNNELLPDFKNKLESYVDKVNGELVNEDMLENIWDEQLCLTYAPLFDTSYQEMFGTYTKIGFRWNYNYNLEMLEKYLNTKEYIIEDEYGTKYSYSKFKKEVLLNKPKL